MSAIQCRTHIRRKQTKWIVDICGPFCDGDSPKHFSLSLPASTTSFSGSDSETEGKQPCAESFKDDFKADSLVEGTSSRYSMYNSVSQKLMVCYCLEWISTAAQEGERKRASVCWIWGGAQLAQARLYFSSTFWLLEFSRESVAFSQYMCLSCWNHP